MLTKGSFEVPVDNKPRVAGGDKTPARALWDCQTQGTPYIYIM